MRFLVAVMVVLAGCGSSASPEAGGACDGGGQCSGGLVCAIVSENPVAGDCEPTCNPDGGTSGCPSGRFCAGNGRSLEPGAPQYTCFMQFGFFSICSANYECQSLNCADGGQFVNQYGEPCDPVDAGSSCGYAGSICSPDGGPGQLNGEICVNNTWCASRFCEDAGPYGGGLCEPDGGPANANGSLCVSNRDCASLNCADAGTPPAGICSPDAGP